MKSIVIIACLVLMFGVILMAQTSSAKTDSQDVSFIAKIDKTKQAYMMILPEGFRPDQPHGLLIVLHGHGSNRMQYIGDVRDECRASRDVAREHKMILVSPDYRETTSWMGPKAEADVAQIITELKAKYRIGKVIVSGASMGGASCLTFAVRRPELVDGVASMNGIANHFEYRNFQDAIAASFGGTKVQVPSEYKNRSAEYWPEKLTMPVGLTVGDKDTIVPPQSVIRLANVLEQLKHPVLLIRQSDGGHSTNYDDAKAILEFVIAKATGAPTTSTAPAGAPP